MASNDYTLEDPCEPNEYPDWIELYNAGPLQVDLSGMYITDKLYNPTKCRIPDGVTIGAGEYLLFYAVGDVKPNHGPTHLDFKLSASGEAVGLFDTDGSTMIDSIEFKNQISDISYGRYPDSSENMRFFGTSTPGAQNVGAYLGEIADTKFSHDRGFYDASFNLSITCETGSAEIHYTLNGSEPNEFDGGSTYLYTAPISITGTTVIRAAGFKPGYLTSDIDAQSYIFIDDVLTQPLMDPGIVATYNSTIREGLKLIPTLSLTMDSADFANLQLQDSRYPTHGMPKQEFPVSAELIYADPSDGEGFAVNCGIEGHSWAMSKHSYKLLFKSQFGPSQLRYGLFESAPINSDSSVEEFNRIVLRAAKNYPVTYPGDQWVRDSQIQMSDIGAHGTFVQLYVNGTYCGVYNATERPDAWFTSSYFGGQMEDYFATSHGYERDDNHISGDHSRFDSMMSLAVDSNLENPTNYEQFKTLCDVEQFADYTVLYWFSGFGDGIDNNWYAGMRNNPLVGSFPPEGFMLYMWDGEFVFKDGVGGNEVPWVPDDDYFDDGHTITDIWLALLENEDFQLLFADRVYKHCFNSGALTEVNAQDRWNTIIDFIDEAAACEQARWSEGLTPGMVDMNGFVNIFISALRSWYDSEWPDAILYPDIDPPIFNQHGGQVAVGFSLTITDPGGEDIYYTLDGSDPRQAVTGDHVGTSYSGPVSLNQSTQVKARAYDYGDWSALNEVTSAVGTVADN